MAETAASPVTPVVETRGLRRTFGRGAAAHRALAGVDLSVAPGEIVLLFGRSGSGKTTLLSVLGGLDRDVEGEALLFGEDLRRLSERRLAALRATRIGFVFQDFHLVPHLTALENVITPNLFAPRPLPRAAGLARGREVLTEVGLGDRAGARPGELSGGQRQRVAVARALFAHPELLLCDEPTGNLDARTAVDLIALFAEIHARRRTTFVIATHEENLTTLPHRRVQLVDGRVVVEGEA